MKKCFLYKILKKGIRMNISYGTALGDKDIISGIIAYKFIYVIQYQQKKLDMANSNTLCFAHF